jgi:hypothetical protein
MDDKFDEISKSLAEDVSRREAMRKIVAWMAGALFAALGISATRPASASSIKCCHYHCQLDPPPEKFSVAICIMKGKCADYVPYKGASCFLDNNGVQSVTDCSQCHV